MTNTMPGYERVFSVSVPVSRAWHAFTDPAELEIWLADRFDADTHEQRAVANGPGGPVGYAVTEFVENERLGYRQWAASPDTGIDVTVVFEAIEGGTRITMTQAGFGSGSIFESDAVRNGMDEALADFVLYLEHGVRFARHRDVPGRSSLGATFTKVPGAVQVVDVAVGEFADQAGLEAGDLLLQLGSAPIFDMSDVALVHKVHEAGEEVTAVFARGEEVCHGSGRLSPAVFGVFATAR
jgi:uncharacterized protein YndB with AHSA1/START domain